MSVARNAVPAKGFSLIELMIVIAIMSLLLAFGAPSISAMMVNRRIYGVAESIQSALNLARTEALRRNARVRFTFVSSLDNSCVTQTSGPSWVVSRGSPVGLCGVLEASLDDSAAPTASDPKTIRTGTSANASGVTLTAGSAFVIFDGAGMVAQGTASGERGGLTYLANPTTNLPEMRIVVDSTSSNAAERRPLWVTVSPNGRVRLCDSKVIDAADPRHC